MIHNSFCPLNANGLTWSWGEKKTWLGLVPQNLGTCQSKTRRLHLNLPFEHFRLRNKNLSLSFSLPFQDSGFAPQRLNLEVPLKGQILHLEFVLKILDSV